MASGQLSRIQGPVGTTYAPNLRFTVSNMTEAQRAPYIRGLRTRPPMPWFESEPLVGSGPASALPRHRGASDRSARPPRVRPPDQSPKTPYIEWPAPPK